MALKRLRTEEMVTISSTLVAPAHPDHGAMIAVPALSDGLAIVNKSYREEAGQAALIQSQLGEAERATLASMVLSDGRTLLDVVNQGLTRGAQLGALDRERAGDVEGGTPTPAEALAARNRWIRTMQTVRDVAALVAAGHPAIREIVARLDAAERAADRRAGSGDDAGAEAPGVGGDVPVLGPVPAGPAARAQ